MPLASHWSMGWLAYFWVRFWFVFSGWEAGTAARSLAIRSVLDFPCSGPAAEKKRPERVHHTLFPQDLQLDNVPDLAPLLQRYRNGRNMHFTRISKVS